MNTKKTRKVTRTKCRDKRSIVRTLNNFSNKYQYIKCHQQKIDLAIEPMELLYSDNELDFTINAKNKSNVSIKERERFERELRFMESLKRNIIFSKSNSQIDSKNTNLILEAIDNLLSINRKENLKKALKAIVESRENQINSENNFLINKKLSILQIDNILNNEKFSKKLFSQIKNRVIFRKTGIYSDKLNPSSVGKSKVIRPAPASFIELSLEKIKYIAENLKLYDIEKIKIVEEKLFKLNKEKNHKLFNSDYTKTDPNSTSYYHPIDEEEYKESIGEFKRSNMTEAMIHKEEHGLYDKELWDEYYKDMDDEELDDDYIERIEEGTITYKEALTYKEDLEYFSNYIQGIGISEQKIQSIIILDFLKITFSKYTRIKKHFFKYKQLLENEKNSVLYQETLNICFIRFKHVQDIDKVIFHYKQIIFLLDNPKELASWEEYGFLVTSKSDFFHLYEIRQNIYENYHFKTDIEYLLMKEDEINMFCGYFDYDEDDFQRAIVGFKPEKYPQWLKEYKKINDIHK